MEVELRTLILEIDPNADPIAGRLSRDDSTCAFSGWIELATALQAALDGERHAEPGTA